MESCTCCYLCIGMFISMGTWFGPKFPPCLFSWLGWLAPHKSCGLWSWNLALCVLSQCHCIKVATFYLFKALIYMVRAPLAHKNIFFWVWFRATWHAQLVCYYFRDMTHFQLLGACDRYKALTSLRLSFQKVPSLSNFLDYLAFLHAYTLVAWPFFDILVSSLPCQYISMSVSSCLFVTLACIMRPFDLFGP